MIIIKRIDSTWGKNEAPTRRGFCFQGTTQFQPGMPLWKNFFFALSTSKTILQHFVAMILFSLK